MLFIFYQVSDTVSQHTGLTASRTCKDQYGAVRMENSLLLPVIQGIIMLIFFSNLSPSVNSCSLLYRNMHSMSIGKKNSVARARTPEITGSYGYRPGIGCLKSGRTSTTPLAILIT